MKKSIFKIKPRSHYSGFHTIIGSTIADNESKTDTTSVHNTVISSDFNQFDTGFECDVEAGTVDTNANPVIEHDSVFDAECITATYEPGEIYNNYYADSNKNKTVNLNYKNILQNLGNTSKSIEMEYLHDAIYAGTPKGKECILIITEGLFALNVVITGVSIFGRKYYGTLGMQRHFSNPRFNYKN